MFHGIAPQDKEFPPSILSLGYSKTVATGSMSKAWSLAGIRVGWVASRSPEIIEQCAKARHYTTIAVSQIDQQIASFALDAHCVHNLLARNIQLASTNLAIVEAFVKEHPKTCWWIRPRAGTTCLIQFIRGGEPVDDVALCRLLMEKRGVLLCPGSLCFGDGDGLFGYVRVGYVCETSALRAALEQLAEFMKVEYFQVPRKS